MDNKEIISQLSLDDKLALLSGVNFYDTYPIDSAKIPSICIKDVKTLPTDVKTDDSSNLDNFVLSLSMVCRSFDIDLIKKAAILRALKARDDKIDVLKIFGPSVVPDKNSVNISRYSEDPYLSGIFVSTMTEAIQDYGIPVCVCNYSMDCMDGKGLITDFTIDERALHEIYVQGFDIMLDKVQPYAIKTSCCKVNGVEMSCNEEAIMYLKNTLNYKGIIIADYGTSRDKVKQLKVGNSLDFDYRKDTQDDIRQAINNKSLSMDVIDENVDNVISFVNAVSKKKNALVTSIGDVEKVAITKQAILDSAILLKNDELLPLNNTMCSIIGDFKYYDTNLKSPNFDLKSSVSEYIKSSKCTLRSILQTDGINLDQEVSKDINRIIMISNVILLYVKLDKGERISESMLNILKSIKKLNKKVCLILASYDPIIIDFDEYCDAILYMTQDSALANTLALDLIFGMHNPSGKLTKTFPKSSLSKPDDLVSGRTVLLQDSIFVGYRYYLSHPDEIKYPFGHGLSYSTFSFRNIFASQKGVTFTITNNSKIDGSEVCQLYISKQNSGVYRPLRELKGFVKVHLQPGKLVNVTIPFDKFTFRFYDPNSKSFKEEDGTYEIAIGTSCQDIKLKTTYAVPKKNEIIKGNRTQLTSYYNCDIKNVKEEDFYKLLNGFLPMSAFQSKKELSSKIDKDTLICELSVSKNDNALAYYKKLQDEIKKRVLPFQYGYDNVPLYALSLLTEGEVDEKKLRYLIESFNTSHGYQGYGLQTPSSLNSRPVFNRQTINVLDKPSSINNNRTTSYTPRQPMNETAEVIDVRNVNTSKSISPSQTNRVSIDVGHNCVDINSPISSPTQNRTINTQPNRLNNNFNSRNDAPPAIQQTVIDTSQNQPVNSKTIVQSTTQSQDIDLRLQEKEKSLKERERNLSINEINYEKNIKDLDAREKSLLQNESEYEKKKQSLLDLQRDISKKTTDLQVKESEIKRTSLSLDSKEKSLTAKEKRLEEKEVLLKNMQDSIDRDHQANNQNIQNDVSQISEDQYNAVLDELGKACDDLDIAYKKIDELEALYDDLNKENISLSDDLDALSKQLESAPSKDDYEEKYNQLFKDMANLRQQIEKENQDYKKYANQTIIEELLPSLDGLDMALRASIDVPELEGHVQGLKMTQDKIYTTLAQFGVTIIEPQVGDDFDPNTMFAYSVVKGDQDDKVAEVFTKGAMLFDHLIRPAGVNVTKIDG